MIFKLWFKFKINIPQEPVNLIDTFVLPGFYVKDRYYNGLWDSLLANEKKSTFFVPTIVNTKLKNYFSVYKELALSERQFLFKEYYLKFTDIIFATLYPLRIQFYKFKPLLIDGINYSPIIKKDMKNLSSLSLSIHGLINFRFIKRLKKNDIKLKIFIDWWESQPIDKGLHRALKLFYPNTMVKGYLGFVPGDFELQIYPTKYENFYGVVPKEISVIGRGFIDILKKFNDDQKVSVAPAFRFLHLRDLNPPRQLNAYPKVLVALPISVKDSVKILKKVIQCKSLTKKRKFKFLIKPHPAIDIEKILNYFNNNWPKDFELVKVDTKLALRKVNIVISGMSSICLESISLGLPTIVIQQSHGIQYNTLPVGLSRDLWIACSSSSEILKSIIYFTSRNKMEVDKNEKDAKKIMKKYFEPVTRKNVLKFLNINKVSTKY